MSYSYRIEQAIRAASVLHTGQTRKGKTPFPYITHLYAVGMLVADYTKDEDIIIAALLHDTLEDTEYTEEELHADFGPMVRDIVLGVTEPKEKRGLPLTWSERKKMYIKGLKAAPHGALIVSAADKIHNMRSIVEEYYDDHAQFLADFHGMPEERVMAYQEISNFLNRELKNPILSEFNHVFDEYKKFIEYVVRERDNY